MSPASRDFLQEPSVRWERIERSPIPQERLREGEVSARRVVNEQCDGNRQREDCGVDPDYQGERKHNAKQGIDPRIGLQRRERKRIGIRGNQQGESDESLRVCAAVEEAKSVESLVDKDQDGHRGKLREDLVSGTTLYRHDRSQERRTGGEEQHDPDGPCVESILAKQGLAEENGIE